MLLPKPVLVILPPDQASNIERIENSEHEVSLVDPAWTLPFSNAISIQVYFIVLRQVHRWMPDIQHQTVDQHHRSIEDVEESLVRLEVACIALPDLDNPIDVSYHDHGATCVQQYDDRS